MIASKTLCLSADLEQNLAYLRQHLVDVAHRNKKVEEDFLILRNNQFFFNGSIENVMLECRPEAETGEHDQQHRRSGPTE